jgi:hypothetical protein
MNKESIKANLSSNPKWAIRAIEVLYAQQTATEQMVKTTEENNGVGFNGTDAFILSAFAEQIAKRKKYNNPILLSDKQLAIAFKKLPKYWKQIERAMQRKETA